MQPEQEATVGAGTDHTCRVLQSIADAETQDNVQEKRQENLQHDAI